MTCLVKPIRMTKPCLQNFESVWAGQPDDSAQAPPEAGSRSPQHRDGTPVWLVHQPKAKTPKTTKHAKSGPKHAKLRTSRAVQGSAYHAAAYAYGGARESNAHSARGEPGVPKSPPPTRIPPRRPVAFPCGGGSALREMLDTSAPRLEPLSQV